SSHHAASRKRPGCRPRGRIPSGAGPGRPRARARTKCRRLWCASASPAPAPAVWLPEWSGTQRDATRIGCRCGKPRAFPSPRRSSTTPLRSGTSGSPSRPTPSTRSTPHEYDMNSTTPIMSRQDDSDPDTQALEIVPEDEDDENDTRVIMDNDEDDDDGSWFLGGMFETTEQQREHQRREYERERRIAKAKEEEARRRLAAFEASSAARQQ